MQQPFGLGRDLMLLSVALEVKHLSIAKYLMATMYARALNLTKHVQALSNVQREESDIDHRLRFIMQDIQLTTTAP